MLLEEFSFSTYKSSAGYGGESIKQKLTFPWHFVNIIYNIAHNIQRNISQKIFSFIITPIIDTIVT